MFLKNLFSLLDQSWLQRPAAGRPDWAIFRLFIDCFLLADFFEND
jgi:hypothetical protein